MSGPASYAMLFPGQGAQAVGMGADLARAFPAAAEVFRRADEALGFALSKVVFEGPAEALERTDVQQPALLAAALAALAAAEAAGLLAPGARFDRARLAAAGGLSLGEYTALAATGALPLEEALRLVRRRGELMQAASERVRSGMAAVLGLPREEIEALCREAARAVREARGPSGGSPVLAVANYLAPGHVTVAGEVEALEALDRLLAGRAKSAGGKAKVRAVRLKVAGAFHTALMGPAADGLAGALARARFSRPAVPVVQGTTGRLVEDPEAIRAGLALQVTSPLDWEGGMRAARALGATAFVEFGPGRTGTGLVRKIFPEAEVFNLGDVASLEALRAAGTAG